LAIQAMGGWATSSMVQRYAHLAGQNLHAEAAAISVPNVSRRVLDARFPSRSHAESVDASLEIPVFIGVDDGIRTHNNRNHNASAHPARPAKSSTCNRQRRLKTPKKQA
jgi:hypothetical protein